MEQNAEINEIEVGPVLKGRFLERVLNIPTRESATGEQLVPETISIGKWRSIVTMIWRINRKRNLFLLKLILEMAIVGCARNWTLRNLGGHWSCSCCRHDYNSLDLSSHENWLLSTQGSVQHTCWERLWLLARKRLTLKNMLLEKLNLMSGHCIRRST